MKKQIKMEKKLKTLEEKDSIFSSVQTYSTIDPCMFTTTYDKDFSVDLEESLTYISSIC